VDNNLLDEKILTAIREGNTSREKLMHIDELRVNTWAVVGERLKALTKRGAVIASKAGWRLSN